MLMNGQGTSVDPQESFRWAESAAHAGYALGMSTLGYMFELGIGVPRDYEKAREWYVRAGAKDPSLTGSAFARGWELGRGVESDPAASFNYWLSMAEAGDAHPAIRAGAAYETGNGVERDLEKALSLYGRAASDGNFGPGMLALGRLSLETAKTAEETAIAVQWLHRAAHNEQIEAYLILAEHYEATGDFASAREMAELAIHYSQGPLARLAKDLLERVPHPASRRPTPDDAAV